MVNFIYYKPIVIGYIVSEDRINTTNQEVRAMSLLAIASENKD